jgi:hypothetical protein
VRRFMLENFDLAFFVITGGIFLSPYDECFHLNFQLVYQDKPPQPITKTMYETNVVLACFLYLENASNGNNTHKYKTSANFSASSSCS